MPRGRATPPLVLTGEERENSLRRRRWTLTDPALRAAPMATAANKGRPVPKTSQETGRAVRSGKRPNCRGQAGLKGRLPALLAVPGEREVVALAGREPWTAVQGAPV
jgi:hypothetical protein